MSEQGNGNGGGLGAASEAILEKIRKLLRLAAPGSGATEEEAALAADRAQGLLLRFKLERADLGALHGAAVAASSDPVVERDFAMPGRPPTWFGMILAAVCDTGFCRCMLSRGGFYGARYWVIGRAVDVAVANDLIAYLVEQVTRLARGYTPRGEDGWRMRGGDLRRARASFALGCASRVARRLREAAQARETASADSRALVVVERQAVDAFMKEHHPRLGTARRSRASVLASHHAAGRAAGDSVRLAAQRKVSGGGPVGRLT